MDKSAIGIYGWPREGMAENGFLDLSTNMSVVSLGVMLSGRSVNFEPMRVVLFFGLCGHNENAILKSSCTHVCPRVSIALSKATMHGTIGAAGG